MKKYHAILALILCTSLIFSGCAKKEEDSEVAITPPSTPVEIITVSKSSIESKYIYSGKVKPVNEVNILSTVAGKIASVNFDVGDHVKAGDVLFKMDTTDTINSISVLQASLKSTDANIASAMTNVELANGASMQTQIESAKTALSNAEITFNNIKTTHENNKVLFESGVISKTAFDESQSGYNKAEISYNQAKESYDIVANQMPAENLRKAQDTLRVAQASKASIQAQIASAQKTLNDAAVTTPISGVVTACNIKSGTVLSQGLTPFTIIDTSKINIDVSVSEQIINSLKQGQEVSVKVAAVSETPIKGRISTVNPAANSAGTYDVKIEIDNTAGTLKSGMFGEAHFTNEKKDNTIVLPRNAVISKNEENYVFIEENGVAKKLIVTLGVDNGNEIEILTGVTEGMNIVTKGQTYLSEGDAVSVTTNSKGE